MISFHPSATDLQTFSAGNSEPAMALMISAHVDMCRQCQKACQAFQEQMSEQMFEQSKVADTLPPDYQQMMEQITTLPIKRSPIVSPHPTSVELDGKTFEVPRTLRRYVSKTGNWSRLVGKLWQAPVDLGDMGKANFIYMEKGGKVPEHTHKGSEITLVIDGQYGDGMHEYDCGDLTILNHTHKHLPHSEADDGCLVFSIVDKPLYFTSGVARLLNPFSHLFF